MGLNFNVPERKDFRKQNRLSGELGLITVFGSESEYLFRTGLKYRRARVSMKNDSIEANWDLDYIDLPLTLTRQLTETLYIIIGLKASFLVADACKIEGSQSTCEDTKVNPTYGQYVFGAKEQIQDNLLAEILINSSITEIFEDTHLVSVYAGVLYRI